MPSWTGLDRSRQSGDQRQDETGLRPATHQGIKAPYTSLL